MPFEDFAALFKTATGRDPYDFQRRFAEGDALAELLRAPTGSGKTATVILGWLWRRRFAKAQIRQGTPRRLVYCLPMRVLVEQTLAHAKGWLDTLDLKNTVGLHPLLGGHADDDWALAPEKDAILVGTQDMLLSRALNRGYAQGRFRWPIDFGLLNNDCLWVFDELQLMASGVSTSAQLAGLRGKLQTFGPCPSVWMSATMEPQWLKTVDFADQVDGLRREGPTPAELTTGALKARMQAPKTLQAAGLDPTLAGKKEYARAVAKLVQDAHQASRLTLVVVNTVNRAKEIFQELRKGKWPTEKPDLLLVHSRFRQKERAILNAKLKATTFGPAGQVMVATQVVEAGVDISARALITELAPWPSLVQRFGRCHRFGEWGDEPAAIRWIDLGDAKQAPPYEAADLAEARGFLQLLEGKDVSPKALEEFRPDGKRIELRFEHKHVLRRRDLVDLFDTGPDLSGNDIDVSRFVRDDEEGRDVQAFWREFDARAGVDEQPPRREELCPVPVGEMRSFLERADRPTAYYIDHLAKDDRTWVPLARADLRPGLVLLIHARDGGYDWDGETNTGLGWTGAAGRIMPVPPPENPAPTPGDAEEGVGQDPWSNLRGKAQTLVEHTNEVCQELDHIQHGLTDLAMPAEPTAQLAQAARYHDLGKAHAVFQATLRAANAQLAEGVLWAKSGVRSGRAHKERPNFRHELASALAMLQLDLPFLAVYLAGAHHGRVRLGIRAVPTEKPPHPPERLYALGVWDGEPLPEVQLGDGKAAPALTLDLSPMRLGGERSWTAQALKLREEWGPFRLAYLEALLRAADMLASKKANQAGEKNHG